MSALYGSSLYGSFLWGNGLVYGSSPDDDISFNNKGLQNTVITTRYIKHESAPEKEYLRAPFPRGNGQILIDSYYRKKVISIRGNVKRSSNALLLQEIEDIKQAFSEDQGLLRIKEGEEIRKYIASVERFNALFGERDYYHIDWVPFECDFVVDLPFGFSDTRKIYSDIGVTTSPKTRSLVMDGSAPEARLISIVQLNAASSVTKITIENTTTGEKIEIERAFATNDILKIDGENQTIQVNGVDVDFSGFPPTLKPGANVVTMTITGSSFNATWTNKFYNYYL